MEIRGHSNNTRHYIGRGVEITKWHRGRRGAFQILTFLKKIDIFFSTFLATFKHEIKQKFVRLKISQLNLFWLGLVSISRFCFTKCHMRKEGVYKKCHVLFEWPLTKCDLHVASPLPFPSDLRVACFMWMSPTFVCE